MGMAVSADVAPPRRDWKPIRILRTFLVHGLAKTNLRTQARAHVILCRSDLALAYTHSWTIIGCASKASNFRDAKQYRGLEDFMNVTPTGVTNAANLALFMVNVAYRLRADLHARDPTPPTASWT